MNKVLCHFCAHLGKTGPGEPPKFTALQTQDLKFEPWQFEAKHSTSRSWRLSTILNFTECPGKKHFFLKGNGSVCNKILSEEPYKHETSNHCWGNSERRIPWPKIKPALVQRVLFYGFNTTKYPANGEVELILI